MNEVLKRVPALCEAVDVAIIGAGIAGSSLAKALADRGRSVLLIDRKGFPRHKVCGEFLSPESIGILSELGFASALKSLEPAEIRAARIHAFGSAPLYIRLPGVAWGLSRFALDEALHREARMAGVEVATGTTVSSMRREAEGCSLNILRGGEAITVRARAVIGAWGGGGRLSVLTGAQRRNKPASSPYLGVKMHFTGIEARDEVELYFFDGGYLGLSPASNGIVNAAALLDRRTVRDAPTVVQGWLELARSRSQALDLRLSGALPVSGTHAAIAPVRLYARPVPWDGIPLVGDACATIPPLCGDGMSMALRAAQLCAMSAERYLCGELSLQEWEEAYARAIRSEFSGPLRWGNLLQRAAGRPLLARTALSAARCMPALGRRLVQATRLGPPSRA
ncbi:NAD(P)/FAD-dependent oxidoreductase [Cohnella hashimotonis]|uniref:NAD(P)/FAD-dependent oxidoreductase n=1 Tax=Cohnella hashimotonis TaxID=2826895 RepID=A0ABT6TI47_9BACL|nr:NAD(P)/FAD-dependent oxidoreductase [Cohnella hashimotonis]MDI4645983.1 NAD(P)/FAD-dependent oxidoreductase [Cohnella hashimotonis]